MPFSLWSISISYISTGSTICAGELIALQTMTNVLNYLKVQKIDFAKVILVPVTVFSIFFNHDYDSWLRLSMLKEWRKCSATSSNRVSRRLKSNRKLKVISSSSMDLLSSLFVPFHSRYLWDGVLPFHNCMLISTTISFLSNWLFSFRSFQEN